MKVSKGHFNFLVSIIMATILLLSCQSTKEVKFARQDFLNLPTYWLTTTMFAGRFYDNDRANLLDYRPFSAIDDVETLDGFILYPPKPDRIIPAGSLVKIIEVSFPDEQKKLARPLMSPREHIWVYLKVAKERGNVTIFHEHPFVLVVPKSITTELQLRGYLGRFLSKNDPNLWILSLPSHLQDGIFSKRPVIGMKKEHLVAAMGPVLKKQFQSKGDLHDAQEIWHYHNYFVVIVDDMVSRIKALGESNNLASEKK